jgi:hypothetical protein
MERPSLPMVHRPMIDWERIVLTSNTIVFPPAKRRRVMARPDTPVPPSFYAHLPASHS